MVQLTEASNAIPAVANFKQAAEILQMSPNTLRKMYEQGEIRSTRMPGTRQRLIVKDELLRLLEEGYDLPETDYAPCSGTTASGQACQRRRAIVDEISSALYCKLHMEQEQQGQIIERNNK